MKIKNVYREIGNYTYKVTRLGIKRMQSQRKLALTGMANAPMPNAYSQMIDCAQMHYSMANIKKLVMVQMCKKHRPTKNIAF